jgi:hypothetical protein
MNDAKSVKSFKASCELLSQEFAKIDKRSHSINNLHKKLGHRNNKVADVWLPCCRIGPPCSSRILATMTDNFTSNSKKLIVACSEVKYCLLSTR